MENLTYIDLSHTIHDGLVTCKGLPAAIVCDYLSREESRLRYAPGTEFQIGSRFTPPPQPGCTIPDRS